MHSRRSYYSAFQPVDKVSYPPIRWLLAPILCCLSDVSAISVFLLMLTWRCRPKSLRHVWSVLLPCDSYEAQVGQCQTTCYSRSSWCWCFPGLITALQLLLAFQNNWWTDFIQCRMPLHGWLSKLVARTMFRCYHADYTGFEYQNVFCSDWQCWCIAAFTALHLATWPQI